MPASPPLSRTLILVACTAAGVAMLIWWLSRPPRLAPVPPPIDDNATNATPDAPTSPTAAGSAVATPRRDVAPPSPLAVDPAAPPAVHGDGRTGAIHGRVHRADRDLADVEVEVVAGLDRSRTTRSIADGTFRLEPLHPGPLHLRLRTAGGELLAERRVMVRNSDTTGFDLDAMPPEALAGVVQAGDGTPIAGASIAGDGRQTWSDAAGHFVLARAARGPVRVVVAADGFATCDLADWPGGERTVRLAPAARLQVMLPPLPGGGELWLYVLPEQPTRDILWQRWNPTRAHAGETLELDDLPTADVTLLAFHRLAHARLAAVKLRAGTPTSVTLQWQALPTRTGRVVANGEAVAGAVVRLTARDAAHAMFVAFGDERPWLRTLAVAALPAAQQQVTTGGDGSFCVAVPDVDGRPLLLEAEHGARRAAHVLDTNAAEVVLDLTPR